MSLFDQILNVLATADHYALGDFLMDLFRLTGRSERHGKMLGVFFRGNTTFGVGELLQRLDTIARQFETRQEHLYALTPSYESLKSGRAALTSYAAQKVRDRLLTEQHAAVAVQRVIHPQLFTSDTQGGIKLPPEVGVDPKATPDACAKDDYLLSLHIIDNPSKVGEFPVLDPITEDVKEELDFRSPVRPPDGMVVLESNKVANSIGLVTRKQRGCHRNRDQV